jgi:hypothetical protein
MDQWSSLEIVKVVIAALVPISVAVLGIIVARLARRAQQREWVNQKLIERRIGLIDEIGPLLNRLYCYYTFRGDWKETTPPEVVEIKRKLDRAVYSALPFITEQIRAAYNSYMDTLYATWNAPGTDARLLTQIDSKDGNRRTLLADRWLPEWNYFFEDSSKATRRPVIVAKYNELLSRLGASIGVEGAIAQVPARQGRAKHTAPITPEPSQFAEEAGSLGQHGQV